MAFIEYLEKLYLKIAMALVNWQSKQLDKKRRVLEKQIALKRKRCTVH